MVAKVAVPGLPSTKEVRLAHRRQTGGQTGGQTGQRSATSHVLLFHDIVRPTSGGMAPRG